MPNEIKLLQKQLDEARAEIQSLRLRLNNVTYILQEEMTASGSLPKLGPRNLSPEAAVT